MQWQAAENGNPTMLVFLGKQYLGQKDKIESKVDANVVAYKWLDDD